MSGLILSCWLDEGDLKTLMIVASSLSILTGFVAMGLKAVDKHSTMLEDSSLAKTVKWLGCTMLLLSIPIFALNIRSFTLDISKDGIIIP